MVQGFAGAWGMSHVSPGSLLHLGLSIPPRFRGGADPAVPAFPPILEETERSCPYPIGAAPGTGLHDSRLSRRGDR